MNIKSPATRQPVARTRTRGRPVLLVSGLALLGAGALLDAGHHSGLPLAAEEHIAYAGHLLTLAGMAITAGAAALVGLSRRRL